MHNIITVQTVKFSTYPKIYRSQSMVINIENLLRAVNMGRLNVFVPPRPNNSIQHLLQSCVC